MSNHQNYKWIVQTPTVKNLLKLKLKVKDTNILVFPFFYDEWPKKVNKQNIINENNFLYVADGSPQKNHLKLFEAIDSCCCAGVRKKQQRHSYLKHSRQSLDFPRMLLQSYMGYSISLDHFPWSAIFHRLQK